MGKTPYPVPISFAVTSEFCSACCMGARPSMSVQSYFSTYKLLTNTTMKSFIYSAAVAALLVLASGCAVSPGGPIISGAAHGALSYPALNFFYPTDAGHTFAYATIRKVYNSDGTLANTYTGTNDTVRTLGYSGLNSPDGDSVFAVSSTYSIASGYTGAPSVNVNYVTNAGGHAAFVDGTVGGELSVLKKPRPVSTDTILAGLIGRMRDSGFADWGQGGSFSWQTDTIYFSTHSDSVFMWDRSGSTLTKVRCILAGNSISAGDSWTYDYASESATCKMNSTDTSITITGGTFVHSVAVDLINNETSSYDISHAQKIFANGKGPVLCTDWYYVTTDGSTSHKVSYFKELFSSN